MTRIKATYECDLCGKKFGEEKYDDSEIAGSLKWFVDEALDPTKHISDLCNECKEELEGKTMRGIQHRKNLNREEGDDT